MKLIDLLEEDYALVESATGKRYIGKGDYWFGVEDRIEVKYTGQILGMELERQRVLAFRILDRAEIHE